MSHRPDMAHVRRFERREDLFREATAAIAEDVRVASARRCSLLLSGGDTPRPLLTALGAGYRNRIAWPHVHVFWGDERYVPHDDPRSNYRMARETLLDHVPIPPANIHPMPTHFADPEAAARDYERTLNGWFDGQWPRFDVAVLGMGADGHTASLFPGSPAVREHTRRVLPVSADVEPPTRLTLTLPVLSAAAAIHVLVIGSGKAGAVAHVLSGSAEPDLYPAAGVQPSGGDVTWWLDEAAAGRLPHGAA